MSARTFKVTKLAGSTKKSYHSNGGARKEIIAGKRKGFYTVPRTMGVVAQTERKYFDSYKSALTLATTVDWTGTEADPNSLNCLFAPTEGSDINNRIGRKVSIVKLAIRGMIHVPSQTNQSAGDTSSVVRLIVYVDQQTNGAQAQGENLMAAPGAATGLNCMSTWQNAANFGRFRVLKDKTIKLLQPEMVYDGTNIEQSGHVLPFKFTFKFSKPIITRFNASNAGTVGDIIDNSLHMVAVCQTASLAPTLSYQARTVYTDA